MGPAAGNLAPFVIPAVRVGPAAGNLARLGPAAANLTPFIIPAVRVGPTAANLAPFVIPAVGMGPTAGNLAPFVIPAVRVGPTAGNLVRLGLAAGNLAPFVIPTVRVGPAAAIVESVRRNRSGGRPPASRPSVVDISASPSVIPAFPSVVPAKAGIHEECCRQRCGFSQGCCGGCGDVLAGNSDTRRRRFNLAVESQAPRRPSGMACQDPVGMSLVAANGPDDLGVAAVSDVAQHHERVAPQVARVTVRDVPAPVAFHQLLVVGGQQVQHIH